MNQKTQHLNALSIDVEEWFQVTSFEPLVKIKEWANWESRVVAQVSKILAILGEYKTKATFFVLGWVAEKHPHIIKEISTQGHEIATHGYWHKLVCRLNPDEFREELVRSKELIQQITGKEVIGYRAPSYSITDDVRWAFDILEEEGIKYDSSVWPKGIRFGINDAARFPYNIKGNLMEFPISTINILGRSIPFSGGLFLRALPYSFISWAIKRINRRGKPVIIYIHPWELDTQQPKLNVSIAKRVIHYHNLKSTEDKLRRLLTDFRFTTVAKVLSLK